MTSGRRLTQTDRTLVLYMSPHEYDSWQMEERSVDIDSAGISKIVDKIEVDAYGKIDFDMSFAEVLNEVVFKATGMKLKYLVAPWSGLHEHTVDCEAVMMKIRMAAVDVMLPRVPSQCTDGDHRLDKYGFCKKCKKKWPEVLDQNRWFEQVRNELLYNESNMRHIEVQEVTSQDEEKMEAFLKEYGSALDILSKLGGG